MLTRCTGGVTGRKPSRVLHVTRRETHARAAIVSVATLFTAQRHANMHTYVRDTYGSAYGCPDVRSPYDVMTHRPHNAAWVPWFEDVMLHTRS